MSRTWGYFVDVDVWNAQAKGGKPKELIGPRIEAGTGFSRYAYWVSEV